MNYDFALERLSTLGARVANLASVKQDDLPVAAAYVIHIGKEHDDEGKLAHNMSQKFKKYGQLTGKLGENVQNFFKNYEEAC